MYKNERYAWKKIVGVIAFMATLYDGERVGRQKRLRNLWASSIIIFMGSVSDGSIRDAGVT